MTATTWKMQAIAAAVAVLLISTLVLRVSSAAFSASHSNAGNSWETGEITLAGDVSAPLFDVSGMLPGDHETHCLTVTYTGPADPAAVKLYVDVTDGGLGPYLDITVREADEADGSDSTCGTLTNTIEIVPTMTLNAFAAASEDYASGVGDWDPSATGQSKTYEFHVKLDEATPGDEQGSSAEATFTWETTT